jgi:hypothetical protein
MHVNFNNKVLTEKTQHEFKCPPNTKYFGLIERILIKFLPKPQPQRFSRLHAVLAVPVLHRDMSKF